MSAGLSRTRSKRGSLGLGLGGDEDMKALVLADSFDAALAPLCDTRPLALLPVGNVPLIDYVLEFLVMNGVREAIVVAYHAHAALESHLRGTVGYTGKSWLQSSEISVRLVARSTPVDSHCDALRDALQLNLLPETFFLVPMGLLTTATNLAQLWARHKERRRESGGTVVLTACCVEDRAELAAAHTAVVQQLVGEARHAHHHRGHRAAAATVAAVGCGAAAGGGGPLAHAAGGIRGASGHPGCDAKALAADLLRSAPWDPKRWIHAPPAGAEPHEASGSCEGAAAAAAASGAAAWFGNRQGARTFSTLDRVTVAYAPRGGRGVVAYQSWLDNERHLSMRLHNGDCDSSVPLPLGPEPQRRDPAAGYSPLGSAASDFGTMMSGAPPVPDLSQSTRPTEDSVSDAGQADGLGAEGRPRPVANSKLPLSIKKDVVVRSDLAVVGLFVCSNELVTEVLQNEVMLRDMNDVLRYLVDNPDYCNYQFAVDTVSDNTARLYTDALAGNAVPGGGGTAGAAGDTASPGRRGQGRAFGDPGAAVGGTSVGADESAAAAALTNTVIALPVTSPYAFIRANVAAAERRLFPLTRERNFAEREVQYAEWPHHPSVFVHALVNAHLGPSPTVGPNLVLGAELRLPARCVLANASVGDGCRLGEGCRIENSVLLPGAVIGRGAVVRHSIVGAGAQVCAGARLESAVLGDGVTVGAARVPIGARLYNPAPDGAVGLAAGTDAMQSPPPQGITRDERVVGPSGVGVLVTDSNRLVEDAAPPAAAGREAAAPNVRPTARMLARPCNTLPLESLFVRDVQPAGSDTDTSDGSDQEASTEDQATRKARRRAQADSESFLKAISYDMEALVEDCEIRIGDQLIPTWRNTMLSYGRSIDDLCSALTVGLLRYVGCKHASDGPKAAWKAVKAELQRLVHEMYLALMRRGGAEQTRDMFGVLRGVAAALADESCAVLRPRAANILSSLYAQADEDLFESKGFCVVSYDSIIAFDDFVEAGNAADDGANLFAEDTIAEGWGFLADYIGQLRADDEDDD